MKTKKGKMLRGLVVVVAFILGRDHVHGQEVDDEIEFSYVRGSKKGPERWGYIHREWAACRNGKLQSPINLRSPRVWHVPHAQRLHFFYSPSPATIKNRGHDIEVKWAEESSRIRMNCTEYVLRQCHWHSPSEHTLRGKRYDMELHLVHENPNDQLAVIAFLYKLGEPDKFLSKMSRHIRAVSSHRNETEAGVINPAELVKERGGKYMRYTGSLTTPPCTEGVVWTIHTKIKTVSHQQLELLREGVDDHAEKNARPLQRRNGRRIRLFKEL